MSSIHLSKGFANIFLNFCNRWRQNSKSLKHFLPVCWFMFKAINRVPWTKSIDVILTSLVMTFNRHFPLGYMEKHVQNYEKNARKRELNVIFTLPTEFQILWCTFQNSHPCSNVWLHRRNFPRNSSKFFRTFILLSYRPFSWYGYFWNFSIQLFFSSEKKALVDILTARSSHRSCSVKKGVLRKFAKFTGKHMCQGFFFNKVASLRPATLLKKIFWHSCFPVNFAKFLRTPFL